MTRHVQPPRMPDHDQHDPLLMAQVAAGDPVDPARAREAQAWLAACPECARLAADLRRVSAAVASEPVPPRRRDFRLTPEQAETARGDAITRFLRGLSLPRARAFGPAAAGILSVGLLVVVAGYAWPKDGSITVQTETNLAPVVVDEAVATPPSALELTAPAEDRQPPAPGLQVAPEAPGVEEGIDVEGDAQDAIAAFAADEEFLDDLAEHQAGTSARGGMQKAAQPELSESDVADELTYGSEAGASEALLGAAEPEPGRAEAEVLPGSESLEQRIAPEATAAEEALAADASIAIGAGETGTLTIAADEDTGPEGWLIVLGALLALGGAGLLLLAWLSRHAADPLMR